MGEWCDAFTNTIYIFGENWQIRTRRELAARLQQRIETAGNDVEKAANEAALFWKNYYSLIFPLRFGLKKDDDGLWRGTAIFIEEGKISLEEYCGALRERFLDGLKLPPILPSPQNSKELISDHCLQTAALLNILLRQRGLHSTNPNLFHAIRLAALVHELALEEPLRRSLEKFPIVPKLVLFLHGQERPQGIDEAILQLLKEVHNCSELDQYQVVFVAGAIQRIKQYVFETPGLSEIRGASTLLDHLVEEFAGDVERELGPEVVLRAAAATVEFLAPAKEDAQGEPWPERFRRVFYSKTGTAFAASAAVEVPVRDLVRDFPSVAQEVSAALGADRYRAKLPITEKLPFEQRCSICQIRPAEGWTSLPDNPHALICRSCKTKLSWGIEARRTKVEEIIEWLGVQNLAQLGVGNEEYVARELSQLIPAGLRRRLIAVIYGDGNNFGGAMRTITSLGLSLQWTNRIAWTIRAATALALAYSTQKGAKSLGWKPGQDPVLSKLPFQILALGGDDLSLITWGRIGLYFCQHFLELTDLEFKEVKTNTSLPIRFSLGAIFVDEKAPVRRTVEFAEGSMLRWAKRAFRESQKKTCRGNVAFILALNVDQIPTDLDTYRQTMFIRGQGKRSLCLTLRPFSSEELNFLLSKAEELSAEHKGRLHRMVQAFFQLEPGGAILYYLYQKAREEGKAEGLCSAIEKDVSGKNWEEIFGSIPEAVFKISTRLPFGETTGSDQKECLFSPLWDLLEIVKILE
mgnify:CR=1 FL=1